MTTSKSSAKSKSTSKADVRNIIKINLAGRKRQKRRKTYRRKPQSIEQPVVRQPTVVYITPFTPTYLNTGFRQPSQETIKLGGDVESRQMLTSISDRLGKIESSGDMLRLMALGEPPKPSPPPKSERPKLPPKIPSRDRMIDYIFTNKELVELPQRRKTPYTKAELNKMPSDRLSSLYIKAKEVEDTGILPSDEPRFQEVVIGEDGRPVQPFMTPPGGMGGMAEGGARA